jgi:pimeloyl-ACP methyl ester carboxylesterase
MSLGGAALLLAQQANPDLFTHLVLLEPVLLVAEQEEDVTMFTVSESPLHAQALRRRNSFVDETAAVEYFQTRRAFSTFDSRSVLSYVRGGTTLLRGFETGSGSSSEDASGELRLSCAPEYEATIYQSLPTFSTKALRRIGMKCDVRLVVGERSKFSLSQKDRDAKEYYGKRVAPHLLGVDVDMIVLDGCTHYAPMENPMSIARLLHSFFEKK